MRFKVFHKSVPLPGFRHIADGFSWFYWCVSLISRIQFGFMRLCDKALPKALIPRCQLKWSFFQNIIPHLKHANCSNCNNERESIMVAQIIWHIWDLLYTIVRKWFLYSSFYQRFYLIMNNNVVPPLLLRASLPATFQWLTRIAPITGSTQNSEPHNPYLHIEAHIYQCCVDGKDRFRSPPPPPPPPHTHTHTEGGAPAPPHPPTPPTWWQGQV